MSSDNDSWLYQGILLGIRAVSQKPTLWFRDDHNLANVLRLALKGMKDTGPDNEHIDWENDTIFGTAPQCAAVLTEGFTSRIIWRGGPDGDRIYFEPTQAEAREELSDRQMTLWFMQFGSHFSFHYKQLVPHSVDKPPAT